MSGSAAGVARPCALGQRVERAWVILFDEVDMQPEVFTGNGAEVSARRRFEALKNNWACSLFREVKDQ